MPGDTKNISPDHLINQAHLFPQKVFNLTPIAPFRAQRGTNLYAFLAEEQGEASNYNASFQSMLCEMLRIMTLAMILAMIGLPHAHWGSQSIPWGAQDLKIFQAPKVIFLYQKH